MTRTDPLRVLVVEDSEPDAELVALALGRGGRMATFERVETELAMRAALAKCSWDVVLSDWSMPTFDARGALAVVQQLGLDVPFIIVSGTVGEQIAVEAMRAGAHDFVRKDELARLGAAVERELREAAVRKQSREMHEHLLISDRMASVGQLAAGVAHEVNNPLAAIIANLDFAAEELARALEEASSPAPQANGALWPDSIRRRLDAVVEPLDDARECTDRVRLIVRDLKVFSRSGDEERRGPVDVRRILESAVRMAWNEIRHRARLVRDFAEVPPVYGNESRLGQVFLNLVVNAAHAIREGGVDANEIRLRTGLADGGRVLVEVGDTGCGIAADDLPRIFDAFFTTKPVGVGTGLGLAICHRIVTGSGGELTVRSDVGRGTTFRLLLPVATHAEPEHERTTIRPRAEPTRRGRVLVVDDDSMVCAAIRRMLGSEHDVVAIAHAAEALERLGAGERFDVILCDLMMPRMSGMELYAELSRAAPDLAACVVFMTGGAFTAAAHTFLDRVPNARLEKPFDANDVRSVVRGLLR